MGRLFAEPLETLNLSLNRIMAKAGGKGVNLKDKLDGNELDLSLSDLNEVPVKELVSISLSWGM